MANSLDAATRARLLVGDTDKRYHFPSEVIREVVERKAGGARRALLQRRATEALARLPREQPADLDLPTQWARVKQVTAVTRMHV